MNILSAVLPYLAYLGLFLLAVFFVTFLLLVVLGRGAIYVPASQPVVSKIVELAQVKPGEKAVDLGAGDGRIVIALARAGAEAHGYETNPLLVLLAHWKIRQAGLNKKAFVYWQSFWGESLSKYNVVVIYGVTKIMPRLQKKLDGESPNGTRVISYLFPFPHWQYAQREKGVYLYSIAAK